MLRADERLANLGAVYMEGDILARQYSSVKWYCFSEHWSKISPGISKQNRLLPIKSIFLKNCYLAWLSNE